MGEKAGVLIVAGNRLLREALVRVLRKRGDFQVVESIPYSPELGDTLGQVNADVMILDSVTNHLAGDGFIRKAMLCKPSLRILLIGMPEDHQTFLRSVRAGAHGFVLDEASATELLGAVRSVCNGQVVCPPSLLGVLFRHVARPKSEIPNIQVRVRLGLTRREQQLVPLIAQGLTNKEIAGHLRISEQTVKNHIHRMLQKVGASDRLAVVDLCRDQGFLVS